MTKTWKNLTKTWKNLTKSWKILKVLESFGTKISKTWSTKFSFPNLVFPRLFFPRHGSLPTCGTKVFFSYWSNWNYKSSPSLSEGGLVTFGSPFPILQLLSHIYTSGYHGQLTTLKSPWRAGLASTMKVTESETKTAQWRRCIRCELVGRWKRIDAPMKKNNVLYSFVVPCSYGRKENWCNNEK